MNQLTSLALTSVVAITALSGCVGQNDVTQQHQITGSLSYLSRIALAPNSVAEVTVRDTSVANGAIIAQQQIDLDKQGLPVPFNVTLDTRELNAGAYSLSAVIKEQGLESWRSAPIGVSAEPGLTDLGNLQLQQVTDYQSLSVMQCGDQRIQVKFADDQAHLQLNDQTLTLDLVKSASGARFQLANDSSTEFWSKADWALLTVNGKTYPECVSDPVALLQSRAWQVTNLNGEDVSVPAGAAADAEASLRFGDDGRLYGRAFCNSFNGSYQLQGDKLSASELASTMMMCTDQQMQHERTMLTVLGHAQRIEWNTSGGLVIFAEDGKTLTAH
ncbi:META domain-containing protein [Oceanisphaera sp.]|uniref:META domain-containing protein n=1 Tax=Oceanisphaera sp. TaxID=1929979 RepID=UPI003A9065B3